MIHNVVHRRLLCLLLSLGGLLGPVSTAAGETCVRASPSPVFDRPEQVAKHVFRVAGAGDAEEAATLPSGLIVRVHHSGCAHFSLLYSFHLPRNGHDPSEASYWVGCVANTLRSISLAGSPYVAEIADGLIQSDRTSGYEYGTDIELTEGYAFTSMRVEAATAETVTASIAFEIAL
jgi:hypothetical protein